MGSSYSPQNSDASTLRVDGVGPCLHVLSLSGWVTPGLTIVEKGNI